MARGDSSAQTANQTDAAAAAQALAQQNSLLGTYTAQNNTLAAGGSIAKNPYASPGYIQNQNTVTAAATNASNDQAKEQLNTQAARTGENTAGNKATIADIARSNARNRTAYQANQDAQNNQNYLNWEQQIMGNNLKAATQAGSTYGASIGGQSSALGDITQLQQSQNQMWGSVLGAGLQAAGTAGAGITKCWIAAAIYGDYDLRTRVVREYLNTEFVKNPIGWAVMELYGKFGRQVARKVRRHGWLKAMFRPVFDRALDSALDWKLSELRCGE